MTTAAEKRVKRLHFENQLPLPIDTPPPTPLTDREATHQNFIALAEDLKPATPPNPWVSSPFAWIKQQPPVSRARTLRTLLIHWAQNSHAPIHPTPKSAHSDFLHTPTNTPIKIHTSTQWDTGEYRFQNIHPTPNHYLALLGITPTTPHLWLVPASLTKPHLISQKWLTINPHNPPTWITPYGGDLATATNLLTQTHLPDVPKLNP